MERSPGLSGRRQSGGRKVVCRNAVDRYVGRLPTADDPDAGNVPSINKRGSLTETPS